MRHPVTKMPGEGARPKIRLTLRRKVGILSLGSPGKVPGSKPSLALQAVIYAPFVSMACFMLKAPIHLP